MTRAGPGARARRIAAAVRDATTAPIGSVLSVRTRDPLVVLTFDDGPDVRGTPEVLTALEAAGAGATFFVLLSRVRRHPELLAEVVSRGHEIGLHGLDHQALPDLRRSFGPRYVAERLRDARAELEAACGSPVRWYRPPYGRQGFADWRAIRGAGMTSVLWNRTSHDWREATPDERMTVATADIKRGSVLLCHDGIAGPDDGVQDPAPPEVARGELVAGILGKYAIRGLTGVSLGTAIARGGTPHRAMRFSR